jgi:hypothetical protein
MKAALALAVAVLAACALSVSAGATTECRGIKDCLDVVGPWVVVPAHTQATYLLDCPRRRGVVGGTDTVASSQDVRVGFEGLLGGPVSPGTTTTRFAFFRALTVSGRQGAFKPLLGCIPVNTGGRVTTSAFVGPQGAPLDYSAVTIPVRAGLQHSTTIGCAKGEKYVDSWNATDFRATRLPDIALAGAVHVHRIVHAGSGSATVSISVSETLPGSARAEVQLGVICAS